MQAEHEGMTLWYGTPDAPAPQESVSVGTDITLTVGIRPADASNNIEVRYRVNQGPIEKASTRWLRNDTITKAQYFRAQFPVFRAGDTVEYGVVCYCAGRMVPSEEEAGRLPVSFRVGDGEVRLASDIPPFQESRAVFNPPTLGEASIATSSLAPIFPASVSVSPNTVIRAVTPTLAAETKAPEISRPVLPPLPTIPLHELTGLVPNVSPDLLGSLKGQNIHSLADIRSMGGLRHIEALKTIKDHPATARLEAHAQLSVLSPETSVREKLIERGFNNLFAIARADRVEFVEKNHDVLGDLEAVRLHAKARAQAAVANNAIVEAKVNAANGWTVTDGNLVTTTSPLIGTVDLGKIFQVVCKECEDCESAVSPLAYLADLIMYVKSNLVYKDKNNVVTPVDYSFLEDKFHQKFGSLPASCELMDARLRQVRIAIEVLREYKKSKASTSTTSSQQERKALRDVYHTLLIKLGTSYAELRLAQTASLKEREELAEKLGLSKPTATEDYLKDLLLDKATLSSTTLLEQKLEELFGFASTQKDPLEARPLPKLLEWRRIYLRELWKQQDFPDDMPGEVYPLPDGTLGNRYPVIDPDLIGPDDFRSPDTTHAAFILWLVRRQWIHGELNNFKAQKGIGTATTPDTERMLDLMAAGRSYPSSTTPSATVKWTVSDPTYTDPKKELSALHQDLTSGRLNKEQVNQLLIKLNEHFGLGADGLNRLMGIWEKDIAMWLDPHNPKVEDEEWNDVCNILTQALKRLLFTKWLEEEKNKKIEFGPNEFWISLREPIEGEWPPTHDATEPWIDPDLLKDSDLPDSTVGVATRIFYETRKTELETFRTGLETIRKDPAKGFNSMLKEALGNPLPVDLDQTEIDLASKDATISGPAENNVHTKLYMTVEVFQRLMTIRAKDNQMVIALKPTTAEYEEAYSILTSAYKLRVMYSKWLTQEPGMEYWQALKARLPRWRASAEARADWQQKLRLRMRPAIIDPDLIAQLYLKHPFESNDAWPIWSNHYEGIQANLALLKSQREGAALPVLRISPPTISFPLPGEIGPFLTPEEKGLDVIFRNILGISKSELDQINKDRDDGKDISARLGQLNLSNEGFNYLSRMSGLAAANATIEEEEWDAVYYILSQVWKERNVVKWHEEEKAKSLVISPDAFRLLEADQRIYLPELPVWRATHIARLDWEDNLQARIDQDQALEDSLKAAVDATEEVTLPTLRDVLIKEAPSIIGSSILERAKKLSDSLLIEMRDNGCAKTTRIAQAIETLQNLLFSVRTGQLYDTYPNLTLRDEALATFDEDWVWEGSYSSWRAAMFVFLYPENILLPSLRKQQTRAFRDLVKGLRTVGQVTPERARQAAEQYSDYFRDVCSLQVGACTQGKIFIYDANSSQQSDHMLNYLFAISPVSKKAYWSSYDESSSDATYTQPFWTVIEGLEDVQNLIGAVVYEQNENQRFIYLFTSVKPGNREKLEYIRYNLNAGSWEKAVSELKLPDESATSFTAKLKNTDAYEPPYVGIWIGSNGYARKLNPESGDWAGEKFDPLTNTRIFSELKKVDLSQTDWWKENGLHTDFDYLIEVNRSSSGYVGGVPTYFFPTNTETWAIFLTADAADYVELKSADLDNPKTEIDRIKALNKYINEHASYSSKYIGGFPNWEQAGSGDEIILGCLLIKKEAALKWGVPAATLQNAWKPTGSTPDLGQIGDRFRCAHAYAQAQTYDSGFVGGFPTFNGDTYIAFSLNTVEVILIRKPITTSSGIEPYVPACQDSSNFIPKYGGPFEIRERLSQNPTIRTQQISNAYEQNKTGLKSKLTYLDEAWYFVPIQIALQLQRSGYYTEALDWFRTMYDYTMPPESRKIFYGLIKEQGNSKDYSRADDWIRDPLDPHEIARNRWNVYTRFTLLSLIRCLLDYADAEFTRDTSESVPLARTLYKTALELLDADELKQSLDGCSKIIGELKIKYGDEIVREIGLEKINNGVTLELISGSITSIMDSSGSLNRKVEAARTLVDNTLAAEAHAQTTIGASIEEGEKQAGELALAIMSRSGVIDQMNIVASNTVSAVDSAMSGYTGKAVGEIEKMDLPFLRISNPKLTAGNVNLKFDATRFMSSIHPTGAVPVGLTPSGDNPPGGKFPTDPRLDTIPGSEIPKIMDFPKKPIGTVKDSSTPTVTIPSLSWSWSWTIPAIIFSGCIPPNPILKALRMRAELNLMKSWTCRNIAGVRRELEPYAAPTDTSSGMPVIGAGGQLILPGLASYRPTPYRYSTLIERAKQLVQLAQQVESSMFSAFQQRDAEAYNQLKARQDLETARANVTLQNLRKTEADAGVTLATLQRDRSQLQLSQYSQWLNKGTIEAEDIMLGSLWVAFGAQTLATGAYIWAAATADPKSRAAAIGQASSSAGQAASALASVYSFWANFERRKQEWEFQQILAQQDILIGNQQIKIAGDNVEVVKQEVEIAKLQTEHAERGAEFLANKFTNTELYEWMAGVLEGVYRYFLQQATSMAKLASDQLAFERQETPPAFIQSDYWEPPNEDNIGMGQGRGPERHGLTGSARLLQDIYQLDQYAFESNKRKLQLSKIISLAALAPVEFQRFRETGVMTFATPMEMFDRDFPGHYLRLIRRVKTSVVALIPPGLGIKATLTASRSTRAVIGGDIFQAVRVQHGPDVVALTSPREATGLFEMDTQPEMQAPFENIGVDASWEFRMPRASNLFDFNTIADVLLTIEYTALNSFDYRDQVIQNLRPRVSADRAFSFRLDFADEWYDLHNPELEAEEDQMVAVFETGRQDFPPNLESLKIQQVVLYFARKDGSTFEIPVSSLRYTEQGTPGGVGGAATSIDGVISTRRGNASSWMSMIGKSPFGKWVLTLPNTLEIKNRFKKEEIEDILFVITYSGRTPDWPA